MKKRAQKNPNPEPEDEQWYLKKPRTQEQVLELKKQAQLEYGNMGGMISVPKFTCEECNLVAKCQLAFDLYNTDGDCLMEK